jgi:hypothetical protein
MKIDLLTQEGAVLEEEMQINANFRKRKGNGTKAKVIGQISQK